MKKTTIAAATLATLLSTTSLAGEKKPFPDYPGWGDGYYAGMKMDDTQFGKYKEKIMSNLRSSFKGDRYTDGIWTFYAIRDWKKERYEANKKVLWKILLGTRVNYPQSPALCEVVLHYLPDERLNNYQAKTTECALKNLELVVKEGPKWPKERFLPLTKTIAERIANDRRKGPHLAYLAGIYWGDVAFSSVKNQLIRTVKKNKRVYRYATRVWSKKRQKLLK